MSEQTRDNFTKWEKLPGAYFDPADNALIARAQSALTGPEIGVCPPLTVQQARDILSWYHPNY